MNPGPLRKPGLIALTGSIVTVLRYFQELGRESWGSPAWPTDPAVLMISACADVIGNNMDLIESPRMKIPSPLKKKTGRGYQRNTKEDDDEQDHPLSDALVGGDSLVMLQFARGVAIGMITLNWADDDLGNRYALRMTSRSVLVESLVYFVHCYLTPALMSQPVGDNGTYGDSARMWTWENTRKTVLLLESIRVNSATNMRERKSKVMQQYTAWCGEILSERVGMEMAHILSRMKFSPQTPPVIACSKLGIRAQYSTEDAAKFKKAQEFVDLSIMGVGELNREISTGGIVKDALWSMTPCLSASKLGNYLANRCTKGQTAKLKDHINCPHAQSAHHTCSMCPDFFIGHASTPLQCPLLSKVLGVTFTP